MTILWRFCPKCGSKFPGCGCVDIENQMGRMVEEVEIYCPRCNTFEDWQSGTAPMECGICGGGGSLKAELTPPEQQHLRKIHDILLQMGEELLRTGEQLAALEQERTFYRNEYDKLRHP